MVDIVRLAAIGRAAAVGQPVALPVVPRQLGDQVDFERAEAERRRADHPLPAGMCMCMGRVHGAWGMLHVKCACACA